MGKVLSILTLLSMLMVCSQSALLAQDRDQVVSAIMANLCYQTDDNCYQLEIILEGMFLDQLTSVAEAKTIDEFNSIINPSSTSDIDIPLTLGDADMDYTFTPVEPCRIVNTRNAGGPFTASETRTYNVYGADMSAQGGNGAGCSSPVGEPRGVMINITAVAPSANGYIAAYPAGSSRPDAAIMSYRAGVNLSNAGGFKTFFGTGPELEIYSLRATDLVIDVMGYYSASAVPAVGADKQLVYNDNGTAAGANVYYDKSTGNVGIGTSAPDDDLAIVNESDAAGMFIGSTTGAYITMESLANNFIRMLTETDDTSKYPNIVGMKARGTYNAYEPLVTDDRMLGIFAKGQKNTSADSDLAGPPSAGMVFAAAENWTGTQSGSYISFFTTENVTGTRAAHMRIDHNGNVGIGTTTPASALQVNGYAQLALTSGEPPPADCNDATERGRMLVDNVAGSLYICVDSGWVAK